MNSWSPYASATNRERDAQDAASEDYPAHRLPGYRLHVFREDDQWEVWLNTEASDFDGLCIGRRTDYDAAVSEAVRALEACIDLLQQPPPSKEKTA